MWLFHISAQTYQLPKQIMEVFFVPSFQNNEKKYSGHLHLTGILRNI